MTVSRLLKQCLQEYDRILASHSRSLTRQQILVMESLRLGPRDQVNIVKETKVDRSTVSEILRRLERSGLVRRIKGQVDHRKVIADLTSRGRSRLNDIRARVVQAEEEFLKPLGAESCVELESLLVRTLEGHDATKLRRKRRFRSSYTPVYPAGWDD